jgi:NAD(P)-dependent dehydrogenase (short-subunit alcohol dehydrogenase family)
MLKEFSLQGKVALVTGAVGLLGREHCRALWEAGASVVVADVDENAATDFAGSLGERGLGIGMDVTSPESLQLAKKTITAAFGPVDVLVNNAAINDRFESPELALEQSSFEKYPVELFRRMMDVNVTGTFLCSQVFGTAMAERGHGSIINVASTYGVVAPDQGLYLRQDGQRMFYKSAGYPATKGAVISFTRFLAAYWGEKGVRVNTLSPGGVENSQDEEFVENYSKRTPLKRMASPRDYRGALVFLASDASSYMTGANLLVDGGWTAW